MRSVPFRGSVGSRYLQAPQYEANPALSRNGTDLAEKQSVKTMHQNNQSNADCAFMIGSTHLICQDYAIARNDPTSLYVVVSDGCSSSPDTDIGARLVARAASQLISKSLHKEPSVLHREATRLALNWARELGLADQSVDATLLTATLQDEELIIGVTGDGVVMIESRQGDIDVFSMSFPNAFPLYPSYAHQPERLEAWKANCTSLKEVRQFRANGPHAELELLSTISSVEVTQEIRVDAREHKLVALMSDGIHSFYETHDDVTTRHNVSLPMENVISELVGFKSGHGSFVARRAKQFSKRSRLIHRQHADDLAVGAIYLGS